MCGIVGFSGKRAAAPIILEALSKLEYRGYDSAGIAVRDGNNKTAIVKKKGRLSELEMATDNGKALSGCCGIGHTRWATHGEPNQTNAHPHISEEDGSSTVIGVHNGIIENYAELKEKLIKNGYTLYSETDTEVAIKLIDYYYKKFKIGPIDAIAKAMVRIRGSYALALMFKDYPDEIWVARKDSPLIIGQGDGESFIASDVPAILTHTRQVYYIDNLQMAKVKYGDVCFYDLNGDQVKKEFTTVTWDASAAEKEGYEHFMMKEIHEQPKVVKETLNALIKTQLPDYSNIRSITIVACGSAWHAGVVGQYVIESLAGIPVRTELASEFRYRNPILDKDSLVIIISQSGETADSLAALRLAKERGIKTLAIVNVLGSSIAREADYVLYTVAGPEIAVATTKAYSAQLIVLYYLGIYFAVEKKTINEQKAKSLISEIETIPNKIESLLKDKKNLQWFASKYANSKDVFFIGRGIDYAISLEASLKLKEISYIHSEAYAAGELKHGTISLIEKGIVVLGVLTQDELYEKTVSNIVECKSRGSYTFALTTAGKYSIENIADFVVYVPTINPLFAASLAIVPLQLLSYYISIDKGLDVDKPRNLAKSVTVE